MCYVFMQNKIVLVEDSPIHTDIIKNAIGSDYSVVAFNNAEEALENIENIGPVLIISDIILPGMDGFDFIEKVKNNSITKEIPVFFLSTLSNSNDEIRGLKSGAVDYLYKPFNCNILKAKIDNQIKAKAEINNILEENRNIGIDESIDLSIKSLSLYFNFKSADTIEHNKRTGYNMRVLAEAMSEKYPNQLSEKKIDLLCKAATIHDIGKIGVSDSILNKNGPLTNEEYEQVMMHTWVGAEIISKMRKITGDNQFYSIAGLTILYHHERWDGSGYPYALSGKNIPLYGRMMSIIDVYDALRSKRPYKPSFSHRKSVDIIINGDSRTNPSIFDPDILEVFKKIHTQFIF